MRTVRESSVTNEEKTMFARRAPSFANLPNLGLLVVSATLLAGCGGSDTPAAPASSNASSATPSAGEPSGTCATNAIAAQLCAMVNITGDAPVSGSTSGLILTDNCADFANGKASGLSRGGLDLPTEFAPIDSVTVTPSIKVVDYSGPGGYAGDRVTGLAGAPGLLVNLDEFNTNAGGSVDVIVAADGSGTVTYTGIKNAAGTKSVSGKIKFTCKEKG